MYCIKLIINHFMDETYKPKCEAKWEALLNQVFNWKSIWESLNETLCSNIEKQFQWKNIHNAIFSSINGLLKRTIPFL